MFSESTRESIGAKSQAYANAEPFPFVVIDNFLDRGFADALLEEFPVTKEANKLNEFGKKGPKTVTRKMREVSPSYERLCDFMVSEEFVDAMSRITGIENLISLPNEAGGAHENRNNSVLEPHLDYNYFGERSPLHRRLNVLLYLNKDWNPDWGGNLQLHSNPREWENNQIVANSPDFNRCIIMETSEHSWHGFDKVSVPEGVSRKSISIYMFTEDRPKDQVAPRHSTFYVQPPISERFKAGFTLNRQDAQELQRAMKKRDNWIHFYQREALRHSARAEAQQDRGKWLTGIMEEVNGLLDAGDSAAARKRLQSHLEEHGN
ncbi:MAG: 2OG-Fe(II) oxygenase [Pseudomonadota bacterium]